MSAISNAIRGFLAQETPEAKRNLRIVLCTIVAIATWAGWWTFWFLTDDAHIEYRYVANLLDGRGLTWNPAPFRPVEGYTSFSWVMLLALVWKVLRVDPPTAAPVLSLGLGLLQLWVVAGIGREMRLPERFEKARPWLVAAAFVGILTNRTFFTWLNSGLETPLFNFTLVLWVAEALRLGRQEPSQRRLWRVTGAAVAMALTRPDGLLAIVATIALAGLMVVRREKSIGSAVKELAPLLVFAGHFAFRLAYYGAPFPNTYYAKHVAAWPDAGIRYIGSFVLEYGLAVWGALALAWLSVAISREKGGVLRAFFASGPSSMVVCVLVAHAGYYTLVIGGDHFEYRVLSHLIPLFFLSAVWLSAQLFQRLRSVALALAAFVMLSWPIQWTHWVHTHNLNTRGETHRMYVPIADYFPPVIRIPVWWFDNLQSWLIPHHVGMRHQEHKIFYESQLAWLPTRAQGSVVTWDKRPVTTQGCVGVIGWVYPNVAVIDDAGLNDYVIARTPVKVSNDERLMAHDRHPPPGYMECFRGNFDVGRGFKENERPVPLTDDDIRECERKFSANLGNGHAG